MRPLSRRQQAAPDPPEHGLDAHAVLGRDPRSLRRYLAGDIIPPTLAAWIASVERVEVTRGRVTVVVRR